MTNTSTAIANGHNSKEEAGLQAARAAAVPNKLKSKLQAGELAHSLSIKVMREPEVVYYAAAAGYDAILIDLEHGNLDLTHTSNLSTAALQVGVTPIVRGAQAVIVPHVNSAKEAENVVRYARFAPLGERSATSGMATLGYSAVSARFANVAANEQTTVICMIETEQALEIVDEIAAVPGVDVLLIGSADLTADMGIPSDFDSPRLADAYARVAAACAKASTGGRLLSCGIGGLNGRPDLIEKFATLHPHARYAMSGADNAMLLKSMRAGAEGCKKMTERISALGA